MDRELPKPVQMIEVFPEKKCYVCGRTEEEFRRDFPMEKVSNLIAQRTQELKQLREGILQEQVQYFKDLLADSKEYPQDLTVRDLLRGEEISKKTMPRYKDLIQFGHIYDHTDPDGYIYDHTGTKESTTIGKIRGHISEIINQLAAGNIPEEAKDTKWFKERETLTLESDGAHLPFDFVKKDVGFLMDMQGRFLQYDKWRADKIADHIMRKSYVAAIAEFGSPYQTIDKISPSPEEDQSNLPRQEWVPESQVLNVKVYIYLCWTCAKMFKEASEASFAIMEAKRDADSD